MEEVVRGLGAMWEIESLRPWLLGAVATAVAIGGLVAAAHRWARRRGADDAIGLRVQPTGRFFLSLLFGLGCVAVAGRTDVPWPFPAAGIALAIFLMTYFGSQVLHPPQDQD
ncbi:hypothetical protein [Variovorax gossypii]